MSGDDFPRDWHDNLDWGNPDPTDSRYWHALFAALAERRLAVSVESGHTSSIPLISHSPLTLDYARQIQSGITELAARFVDFTEDLDPSRIEYLSNKFQNSPDTYHHLLPVRGIFAPEALLDLQSFMLGAKRSIDRMRYLVPVGYFQNVAEISAKHSSAGGSGETFSEALADAVARYDSGTVTSYDYVAVGNQQYCTAYWYKYFNRNSSTGEISISHQCTVIIDSGIEAAWTTTPTPARYGKTPYRPRYISAVFSHARDGARHADPRYGAGRTLFYGSASSVATSFGNARWRPPVIAPDEPPNPTEETPMTFSESACGYTVSFRTYADYGAVFKFIDLEEG